MQAGLRNISSKLKMHEQDLNSSQKSHKSPRKYPDIKQSESKSYTFNLNSFQKAFKGQKEQLPKSEESIQPVRESLDEEKESQRSIIYSRQSYQEKYEQVEMITTAQSNNDLFSMIFLNKSGSIPVERKKSENEVYPTFNKDKKEESISLSIPQKIVEKPEKAGGKVTDYQIGKKLGAGKFGHVFLARHKATGFFCALKKIQKSKIESKLAVQLVRQIKIQSFLNHPNIVKMYAFFADQLYIYIAMELCYSGQLYNYLKKKRRIPEDATKNIVQQICRALDYMHENEIIHRDLKPQNIIYQSGLVKICDFGWSISTNTMRGTFCGTPLYVSPELLKRKNYNNKIDVWSVGILTYELLFGRVPFEIQTEQDFIKIVEDEIKFSKVTKISNEAKDFILNCLQKDPRDRCTISQMIQHVFLSKQQNPSMVDMY